MKQNTKNVFGSRAYRPQLDKSSIKERVSNLIHGNTQPRSKQQLKKNFAI
jgi:hypothetical protein